MAFIRGIGENSSILSDKIVFCSPAASSGIVTDIDTPVSVSSEKSSSVFADVSNKSTMTVRYSTTGNLYYTGIKREGTAAFERLWTNTVFTVDITDYVAVLVETYTSQNGTHTVQFS